MSEASTPVSLGPRGVTRRRALRIVAAAAGLPLMIAALRATVPAGQLFNWQGEVLGGLAELSLWHTDEAAARHTMRKVEAEIARYESIFSLAREESESLATRGRYSGAAVERIARADGGGPATLRW